MASHGDRRSSLIDRLEFIGLDADGRARPKALEPTIAMPGNTALAAGDVDGWEEF